MYSTYTGGKELENLIVDCIFYSEAFSDGSVGKEPACNTGGRGLIPWSGRSLGEGNGYPLQNSCLENSMNRGDWRATDHGVPSYSP